MLQVLGSIRPDFIKITNFKLTMPFTHIFKSQMETLIHHFKLFSSGAVSTLGSAYMGLEAPKGEFGMYLLVQRSKLTPY